MEESRVTVIEEWSEREMIRYVPHSDGTRTVLEQSVQPRPFVRFLEPIEFSPEYLALLDARSRSQTDKKNRTNETQREE